MVEKTERFRVFIGRETDFLQGKMSPIRKGTELGKREKMADAMEAHHRPGNRTLPLAQTPEQAHRKKA